jgi:UDP-N-acetylglucosamine 2-epimerase (non-hydrolysing)
MKKILVVFGTRPEIIKMFPVIEELKRSEFECVVLTTAQHREMTDMFMQTFGISPDIDLDLMQARQTLPDLTARLMSTISPVLAEHKPDMVLVQGDTTTVMVTALAAAYQQIPVGHVEAGLRTDQLFNPFPEEINRRLCGQLTRLHFAPTPIAEQALLAENIPAEWIYRTGNTVIDAILRMHDRNPDFNYPASIGLDLSQGQRLVLVTAHRRENWGAPMAQICQALLALCERYRDLRLVFPVHRNPIVRETVFPLLENHPQIQLVEPLDYIPLMDLIRRSSLVLTDSGGIQEEAPSLGKPVLVMRETTERPEGVAMGTAKLVGTEPEKILAEASRLLDDPVAYQAMSQAINPYGDGHAAERIVQALRHYFGTGQRPAAFDAIG